MDLPSNAWADSSARDEHVSAIAPMFQHKACPPVNFQQPYGCGDDTPPVHGVA